jgi:membrane protease YdiL (CAAX protease family)
MYFINLITPFLRLFFYFILASSITSYLFIQLSGVTAYQIGSVSFFENHPEIFGMFAFSDIIGKIIGFVLLPYYFTRYTKETYNLYVESPPKNVLIYAYAALLVVSIQPLIAAMSLWNKQIPFDTWMPEVAAKMLEQEKLGEAIVKMYFVHNDMYSIIFSFIGITVIPAISEEYIFRGVFQQELLNRFKNKHIAVWVAAFVFSFIHFQFYGFFPRMALGALFGYCLLWSNSIWVPILMHFTNNAFTWIITKRFVNDPNAFNPENAEQLSPIYVVIAAVLFLYLIYQFIKQSKYKHV